MPLTSRMTAAILTLSAVTASGPLAADGAPHILQDSCLALAVGNWLPDQSGQELAGITAHAVHLRLTNTPNRFNELRKPPARFLDVAPAPLLAADTSVRLLFPSTPGSSMGPNDLAAVWRFESDSFFLFQSVGFWSFTEIYGTWHGDTLIARVHKFGDASATMADPRANVFGVRYACDKVGQAREAAASAEWLATHDSPDLARDQAERLAEQKRNQEFLQSLGTTKP